MNSPSLPARKASLLLKILFGPAACFLLLQPSRCVAQTAQLDEGLLQLQSSNYPAAASSFSKVLQQNPENYSANLSMGIALRELGQFDSALIYLDQAIRIDPKIPDGYLNRGMLFYALKAYAKGDNDERTAMQLRPASALPYELRGYSLLQRKRYPEAITTLDSALFKDKTTYKAYLNKAAALGNMGRYEDAIVVLDQVIDLKPDYTNAYYDRAYTYLSLGDMDRAFADCNKLLELDNKNVDGLLLRAGLKDKTGDDPGAIDDCNTAIAINSNNANAYNQRAIARFDMHDYANIISDCNHAIALKPDYYDAYVQRGDAYDDAGDFDKAIADYKKAISLEPDKLVAYRECAASEAHKSDYKTSLYYLDKGLLIEPGNKYLLDHKYQVQQLTGDLKGAISTLNQCIKFHSDSSMLYTLQKAYIYDSLHDDASACKFAYEALKTGLADGYDYLTTHPCAAYKKLPRVLAEPWLEQAQKEYAEGMYNAEIATLTKAISLMPDSSSLYYNRGAAKRKLNNFGAAIDDYNKAIALRPKFPDAIVARAVAKTYLHDAEGAMKDCQLAIKVDSTYAIAYNNYANLIEETDIPAAIDYYTKAVHFNKKYALAYLSRGKLYLKQGKKEAACFDFRKAEALGSDDAKIERMVNCK